MAYKRRKRTTSFRNNLLFGLVALPLVLLIISMYRGESPTKTLSSIFSGPSVDEYGNPILSKEELIILSTKQDSLVEALQKQLDDCRGTNNFQRAIVEVESPTLNMRSDPSLISSIVLKIPNQSEIQVLYFDTNVYIMDGLQGKWCKIKYANQEGWVWGNFIRLLN